MTETLSPIARWAREQPGCRLVILFGAEPTDSTELAGRTERSREGRDLDLAVLLDRPPGSGARLRIMGELQELAAPRSPDVFFLRSETDCVLGPDAFRDGECLYEVEPGIFVHARFLARNLHRPDRGRIA